MVRVNQYYYLGSSNQVSGVGIELTGLCPMCGHQIPFDREEEIRMQQRTQEVNTEPSNLDFLMRMRDEEMNISELDIANNEIAMALQEWQQEPEDDDETIPSLLERGYYSDSERETEDMSTQREIPSQEESKNQEDDPIPGPIVAPQDDEAMKELIENEESFELVNFCEEVDLKEEGSKQESQGPDIKTPELNLGTKKQEHEENREEPFDANSDDEDWYNIPKSKITPSPQEKEPKQPASSIKDKKNDENTSDEEKEKRQSEAGLKTESIKLLDEITIETRKSVMD